MPKVLRMDGFAFVIYPNDHAPPHVHVQRAGCWCKISIGDGDGDEPPGLMDVGSMRRTDAGRALWIVHECWELLLAQWRRYHDPDDD